MLFDVAQKKRAAEFFGQLEDKIEREKASVAAKRATQVLLKARKAVVDTNISILIDGQQAPVSIQDETLGAVMCPVCQSVLRTPDGSFDHVVKAFDDMDNIKPYSAETLTHCKQCNELYKVEIEIRGSG